MAKGKLSRLSREIEAVEKLGFDGIRGKQWARIAAEAGGIDNKPMRVHEAESRLSGLHVPDNRLKELNLSIRAKHRSGNIVLRGEDLAIGYPGKMLFEIEELELRRQECVAMIGPNGSGKTSFLRTLLGQLEPLKGELRTGASLKIGYFAQAHEGLNPTNTLIEEIDRMGAPMLEKDIRSYLGRFLFHGEDHYKKVSVLSGGERGRMALAKLGLIDANFLLLDEPSNHLDIPGQEILQQVLTEFEGTILMVSHDRYLIDALATQIWDIDPETHELKIFKGSYQQFIGRTAPVEQEAEPEPDASPADEPEIELPEVKKLSKFQRQRIQTRINVLEDRIIDLEDQLEKLGEQLQNPPSDADAIQQLGEDYAYLESELAELHGGLGGGARQIDRRTAAMISLFDLFKVGIGPSSSHTVGPMVAARRFGEFLKRQGVLESVARLRISLHGSLGLTGHGHASDLAILLGLSGLRPDAVDPDQVPVSGRRHPPERGDPAAG